MRRRIVLDVEKSGSENISVSGYMEAGRKFVRVCLGHYGFVTNGLVWKAVKNGANNQGLKGGPIRAVVKLDNLDDPEIAKPSLHVAAILDTPSAVPVNGDQLVKLETEANGTIMAIMSSETAKEVNRAGIEEFLTPDIVTELLKEGKTVKLALLTAPMCQELSERLTWVEAMLSTYGTRETTAVSDDMPLADDISDEED